MADRLFLEERRQRILDELQRQGRVSVRDLSNALDVSEVTIRQDLRALEQQNHLERTHGGAVLPTENRFSPELSFDVRNRVQQTEKDAIAQYAASLVKSGESIAMDASTTCFRMLPSLKQLDRLIIVTNSLIIAQSCLDSPHIEVFMPGGKLRRDSMSLVEQADSLPEINLTQGFFGAHGVTDTAGITESTLEEVEIKQATIKRCLAAYILVDSSKWGRVAPFTLVDATTHPQSQVITTNSAPAEMVYAVRQMGIDVLALEL